MKTISLKDYNIYIGSLDESWNKYFDTSSYSAVFVLVDEHTKSDCYPKLKPHLGQHELIEINSGEINKSIEIGSFIWRCLIRNNADRKALMINLGGGVIGDMGGFCASTYKRGIDFVQVPTTLLAMVDASIGGKLAIDFDQIKNCIGIFNNPKAIFLDPGFLRSLPENQLVSGMTEILKHGLLGEPSILDRLNGLENLSDLTDIDLIHDAIKIKRKIVQEDPYEMGLRKVLNLGHTIGHAIESYYLDTDEPLTHGEAIAAGLICELYLSHHLHELDLKIVQNVEKFVKKWYKEFIIPPDNYSELLHLLLNDKKNEHGKIYFSLLKNIGEPIINQVISEKWVIQSFDYYNGLVSAGV